MTDKPILFSGPMVRAILDGRKTQTRRVLKLGNRRPDYIGPRGCMDDPSCWGWEMDDGDFWLVLRGEGDHLRPQWTDWAGAYRPGDRLWVRESWATVNSAAGPGWGYRADSDFIQPEYDGEDFGAGPSFDYDKYPGEYSMWYNDLLSGAPDHGWKPSIHMPRWASRLTLTVTDVRVQRLRDISREDAISEGIQRVGGGMLRWENWSGADGQSGTSPQAAFALLWDSLNATRSYGWEANPWVCAVTFEACGQNIDRMER